MNVSKTIIAVVVSILLLFFPVVAIWIIAAFCDLKLHFLVPVIGLLLVILVGFISFGLANKRSYKKTIVSLSVVCGLLALSLCGEHYYRYHYIPSITVGQQSPFSGYYKPFTNSDKLARLTGEPELTFLSGDELPVVDGATALFPVYCSFVEAVYPKDCDVESCVHFSTTSGAYKKLIAGEADLIFVAQPSKEQLASAKDAGLELDLYPIGYEAFVFIVNKKNPVSDVTIDQLRGIYTGNITNWKELGGKDREIRPFQRDEGSGSQTAFLALMGKDAGLLPAETHKVQGMDGLVDVVSNYENHDNAIGYSFRYYIENMKNNGMVKILSLNGVTATKENIRNKSYPVTGNFYAISVKGRESENTRRLIEWVLGAQGQELIEKVGYVPL